ncbi:MAG: SDR family NAD(P)-dependent oxidoreductase [Nitrososphaerales archaeon]
MIDRRVIVTGAGSGMGAAMVREFVDRGDIVAALDLRGDAVTEVADALPPGRCHPLEADVSDPDSVAAAIAEAVRLLGGVDVLCNNAGVLDDYHPLLETSLELWHRVLSTDLTGPFLVSRSVLSTMIGGGGGAVVNTASISSFVAGGGGAAYTSAKHGLLGLTRQMAFDYGRNNVRVNAICPGAVRTGLTRHLFDPETRQEHVDAAVTPTPAGRGAVPEEIARLAAFLASETASFIHGAAYVIDGGWTVA